MERENEIKLIAYQIWEEEGCCEGRDMDHWIKAEVVWKQKQAKPEQKKEAKPAAKKEAPKVSEAKKTAPNAAIAKKSTPKAK